MPETPSNNPPAPTSSAGLRPVRRVSPELRLSGAARLITEPGGSLREAAQRFVTAAPTHGIDLSLFWATTAPGPGGPVVRQVCLLVPGAGRTGILFMSPPGPAGDFGRGEVQQSELASCIRAATEAAGSEVDPPISIVQALPSPGHTWARDALREAGFTEIGELAYLRRRLTGLGSRAGGSWPAGVEVVPIEAFGDAGAWEGALLRALERTYIDTLDCPELCGLRETRDVLDSHRSAGLWDPALWWLILLNGEPEGCLLLNHSPDQDAVELVYIGLSPALRGQGLSLPLLEFGLQRARQKPARYMTCAVDRRNTPALRLYKHAGFHEIHSRVGMIRKV